MTYRQILDEAIGDSPLSTVDVDRVIAVQRRARTVRRWVACGAGAAAVLAVTVLAAQVLPSQALPEPADDLPITTVAGTAEDMARLDNAVFASLKRVAPTMAWTDSGAPGTPGWSHDGGDKNTIYSYWGQGGISVGGVEGHFMVSVKRYGSLLTHGCLRIPNCQETAGPHGEQIWKWDSSSKLNGASEPAYMSSLATTVLRPGDDTLVHVSLLARVPAPGPAALTLEEMTLIALDPAIALAPVPPGVVVTTPAPGPSEPPRPSTAPTSPTPSPQADPAQKQRIDNAVFASLRRQAPGVKGQSGDTPVEVAAVWSGEGGENNTDNYWGQARIVVNGVAGLFDVQMVRKNTDLGGVLPCDKQTKAYTCKKGTGPRGEQYRTVTNTSGKGKTLSADRNVAVLRKDGSWLAVNLSADPPAAKFALTPAQQLAIALDRAITLTKR